MSWADEITGLWRYQPAATRKAVKLGAVAVLGALALVCVPWHQAARRRDEARALAPLVLEAERLGLDYSAVLAAPATARGKPVLWCIDNIVRQEDEKPVYTTYTEGRPSQPIVWSNPEAAPSSMSATSGGRCLKMLATVDGAAEGRVRLRFVAAP